MLLARQQQELLELAAEEFRATRIVESERGQRIEHAIRPGVPSVIRLDADDRHYDFRRNAEFVLGASKRCFVGTPEVDARFDPRRREKPGRELVPQRRDEHWTRNRFDDLGLVLHLREQAAQCLRTEAALARHFGNEVLYLR